MVFLCFCYRSRISEVQSKAEFIKEVPQTSKNLKWKRKETRTSQKTPNWKKEEDLEGLK